MASLLPSRSHGSQKAQFDPRRPSVTSIMPDGDVPNISVWTNTGVGILLLLLIFGGSVSIGAIFSVGAIAAYVAFTIPIFIRVFFVGNRFRRGPWHLGKFSKPIGAMGCAFILVMMPILCFPSVKNGDLTAELMNWTIVVYGGPMAFVIVWWIVSARHWFKGPVINVDHQMLGRDQRIEGIEHSSDSDNTSENKKVETEAKRQIPQH